MATYELEHSQPDDSGIAVVAVTGELDLTNADELLAELASITDGARALVLDLSRLAFIDSAAIHQLFQVAQDRSRNSFAFVVEPTAAVAGTLEIVELDRAAPVLASVGAAKALLARADPA